MVNGVSIQFYATPETFPAPAYAIIEQGPFSRVTEK